AATPTDVNTTPVSTQGLSFKDFMSSFKTPVEQPQASSQVLHSTLPNDPNKEYGALLPFAKDKTTGELELAVPGFVRDTVHGLGDVYGTAEESAKRGEFAAETVTPEAALT